jgi:hypothetical protein
MVEGTQADAEVITACVQERPPDTFRNGLTVSPLAK